MAEIFPGVKIQKISLDAGFSCPNRDGTIGIGGCSYCNNASFSPSYCSSDSSVEEQISRGKAFFARKYPKMKYIAYFQSYTNTHARSSADLEKLWRKVLDDTDVVGLSIATRPDCLPDEVVEVMSRIAAEKPIFLELGAESAVDSTLRRVNRRHTWHDVEDACERAAAAGLRVGLHLIAGLPGESRDDILYSVRAACSLPIESLKIHHLQIIRDTLLCNQWENGEFKLLFVTPDEYLEFCKEVVRVVPANICIERFLASAPPDMVLAPKWGLKNYQFVNSLHNLLLADSVT